jgi:hypothetical protein
VPKKPNADDGEPDTWQPLGEVIARIILQLCARWRTQARDGLPNSDAQKSEFRS